MNLGFAPVPRPRQRSARMNTNTQRGPRTFRTASGPRPESPPRARAPPCCSPQGLACRPAARGGRYSPRLRDDDEREEARIDGDVERRVAVGDERERDEEDGAENVRAEAHPAAQERRVRLVERVVREADRGKAQHGRSHPWFWGRSARWGMTCERATHRHQSTTDALVNFLCLNHLAQWGCWKNNDRGVKLRPGDWGPPVAPVFWVRTPKHVGRVAAAYLKA